MTTEANRLASVGLSRRPYRGIVLDDCDAGRRIPFQLRLGAGSTPNCPKMIVPEG